MMYVDESRQGANTAAITRLPSMIQEIEVLIKKE